MCSGGAGSLGIALLATFYAARTQLTGSAVTALHNSALVLAAVSVGGALAALLLRGRRARRHATMDMAANDAG